MNDAKLLSDVQNSGLLSNILKFQFNDVFELTADSTKGNEADGVSAYTATATLNQNGLEAWNVTFTLSSTSSGLFVKQKGQAYGGSDGTDRTTLIAPLNSNKAVAQLVDTDKDGEDVKVWAKIENSEVHGGVLVSDPTYETFTFDALPKNLALDLRNDNPGVQTVADGVNVSSATATLVNGTSGKNYGWSVTFALPKDKSAKFVAQAGQSYGGADSTDRTILIAPLASNSATAQIVDENPKGETVTLNAAVDNAVVDLSAPAVNFPFSAVTGLYLTLEGDTGATVAADGQSAHSATATLGGTNMYYPLNVTFTLPANKSATFLLQQNQRYGDNGTNKQVMIAPLAQNVATAKFVDPKGETVALQAVVDYDENQTIVSSPKSLSFQFTTQGGGSFDNPKYFKSDANARENDIYQLIDGDFPGTGYIEGAYYICVNPNGLSNAASYPPPALGEPDNENWAHAWKSFQNGVLDTLGAGANPALFGNGNHCLGVVLYFDPGTGEGGNHISPDWTLQPGKYFKSYMETLGFVMRSQVKTKESEAPPNGFSIALIDDHGVPYDETQSLLKPTPYTAVINGSRFADTEDTSGTAADDSIEWCAKRYYTSKIKETTKIGLQSSLPDGTEARFGTTANSNTTPIQVTVYTSTKYNAVPATGGLGVDPKHMDRGVAPPADDNDYWKTHPSMDPWPADFYWRQDNYRVAIRNNDDASINNQASDKEIFDITIDGMPLDIDGNTGPSSYIYCESSNNCYTTDAYICWTGTSDLTARFYMDNPVSLETGNFDGSITLVLVTYVRLFNPFGLWPSSPGLVSLHDQYGNEGSFYLNCNIPPTYYPKDYGSQDIDGYPKNSSIAVVSNTEGRVLSKFDDVIVSTQATPTVVEPENVALYSPSYQKWAGLSPDTFPKDLLRWVNLASPGGTGGVSTWRFMGVATEVPNGIYTFYNSGYGGYSWGVKSEYSLPPNVFAQPGYVALCTVRPVWDQNGFLLFNESGYTHPETISDTTYDRFAPFVSQLNKDFVWRFTNGRSPY
ncbi:hypothetical protein [Bordetella bronchialis]|uniref:Uncharacterized protein n=1 Tax=Bordetella bronchialis TaxID=463025 RepID=A0ABM6CW88_9BORD|nr:hypothetical protein [Bordetella bronchialis]ANN67468.1 hypothetical protein BAU06_15190 [Bordetella bronchialis]